MIAIIMLIIYALSFLASFRVAVPFIQTELQSRGLYGAYLKKRIMPFLAVPNVWQAI